MRNFDVKRLDFFQKGCLGFSGRLKVFLTFFLAARKRVADGGLITVFMMLHGHPDILRSQKHDIAGSVFFGELISHKGRRMRPVSCTPVSFP